MYKKAEMPADPAPVSAVASAAAPARALLGRYRGLVTPGAECDFDYGGFPLPDGSFWRFREPEATVVVEHDRLRVAVHPLTRKHDRMQVLDNAKNMYFSKAVVAVPEEGEVSVEAGVSAHIIEGRDDDLYSGFVSLHVLDFQTGLAFDWFVANRKAATVYARLHFPGVEPQGGGPPPAGLSPGGGSGGVPPLDEDDPQRPRYFCVFHEPDVRLRPGEEHRYRIAYRRDTDTVRFLRDGDEVDVYPQVPVKMDQFLIALGIMTEKPIGEQGSVSLFGQGAVATWTEVAVEGAAELRR